MSKARIVLIDDNDNMRENIKEILELDNYSVYEAANGKEGIRLIRQVKPDLIVCDIMMPELDGYGVLRIVNQNKETAGIPFIFLTAKNNNQDFRKGMNMGADDYLTKPFTDAQLIEAIDMRLNRLKAFQYANKAEDDFIDHIDAKVLWSSDYFDKNQVIYRAGAYSDRIYHIQKGQVKLTKQSDTGKTLITDILQPGDYFGHIDVIAEKPYSSTAITITALEVSFLDKKDFQISMLKNKLYAKQVAKELAQNLGNTEDLVLSMAFSTVKKRIVNTLINLNIKFNRNNLQPYTLNIKRNEIAALSGTVKETAIRCLKELEEDGCIDLLPRGIKITDLEALENLRRKKVT